MVIIYECKLISDACGRKKCYTKGLFGYVKAVFEVLMAMGEISFLFAECIHAGIIKAVFLIMNFQLYHLLCNKIINQ